MQRLSVEQAAEKMSDLFCEIMGSRDFLVLARAWSDSLSQLLFQLEAPMGKLVPLELAERVPPHMLEYAGLRYNSELRLAALALATAGILTCDEGTPSKLDEEEVTQRYRNFCESLRRVVHLVLDRGTPVEMGRNPS